MSNYHEFIAEAPVNQWDQYYKDWGYIKPTGKVERLPKGTIVRDGHEQLADKLGYDGIEDALRKGLCRFLVSRESNKTLLQLRDDPRIRAAVSKFIDNNATGPVDIEMFDRGFNRTIWHREFDTPRKAVLQMQNAVTEAQQTGYITPDGKIVLDGQDENTALAKGFIRFTVDSSGDINLTMLNKKPQREAAVGFLKSVDVEDNHQVYVEFVTSDGNIAGYKDYESIGKAVNTLAKIPDGLVGLEEEIPALQEAPIAAYSREWGFIRPNGNITKGGDDPDGHLGLARKMGFQSETDALLKEYIRYVIDQDGNITLEFVPTHAVKYRATKWLQIVKNADGAVYIDTLNQEGANATSNSYENKQKAIAGIAGLKDTKDVKDIIAEDVGFIMPTGQVVKGDHKTTAGYSGEGYVKYQITPDSIELTITKGKLALSNAVKFLKTLTQNTMVLVTLVDAKGEEVGFKSFTTTKMAAANLPGLSEDYWTVYHKPDKQLEPFTDHSDNPGAPEGSGDVPGDDGSPIGAIAGQGKMSGLRVTPPFIAST